MRTVAILLFSLILSLNSAHTIAVGIGDTLQHASDFTAHFGHHEHEHDHDHDHDHGHGDEQAVMDVSLDSTEASDHHHIHVYPSFIYLLSDVADVVPLAAESDLVATPLAVFISAPLSRLERPPKTSLA